MLNQVSLSNKIRINLAVKIIKRCFAIQLQIVSIEIMVLIGYLKLPFFSYETMV